MYSENDDLENDLKSDNKFINFYNENKKIIIILAVVVLLFVVVSIFNGCSSKNITESKNNISVKLSSNKEMLSVGNSFNLTATITGVENDSVTFISSNPSIATVSEKGIVEAISSGVVTIKALYQYEGKEYEDMCIFVISKGEKEITKLSFTEENVTLNVGEEHELLKSVEPTDAITDNITYKSSNEQVATVVNGKIKAVSAGNVIITMSTSDNSISDDISVIVLEKSNEKVESSITFDSLEKVIVVGQSARLNYQLLPIGTSTKLTWTSSDNSVVEIDDGTVTGLKEGSSVITAKSDNGISESITVKVTSKTSNDYVNVTGISILSINNVNLSKNATSQIYASVSPYNATNNEVVYLSNNTKVATVSSTGLIKAVGSGKAIITVKTFDKGYTTTVNVNVTDDESFACDVNKIQIESNSGNALSSNTNGNDVTVKNNFTIITSKIDDSFDTLEYCYSKSGYICTPYHSFKKGDNINITLPSGNGVLQFIIRGTCNKTAVSKMYFAKYSN